MGVEKCPHCGVQVFFGADAVCPRCRVHRDAPVTQAHVERAAVEDLAPLARVLGQEANARRARRRRIWIGLASIAGAVGLLGLTLLPTNHAGIVLLPWGLFAYGAYEVGRGLLTPVSLD